MKTLVCGLVMSAALVLGSVSVGEAQNVSTSTAAANKRLVMKAMTELFIKRDGSAVARYWGNPYIQHNPSIANGSGELPGMIAAAPPNFKYEPGMIVADGDKVMIHGRYTGWGPKPVIVVDIFRVKAGKLVEHWDVVQEEVPASKTKSGNAMFEPGQ